MSPLRFGASTLGATGIVVFALACSHGSPPPAGATVAAATPPASSASSTDLRFDIGAIDLHADPCNDFYSYACGGWRATHPIPADRTRWSRYSELDELNQARVRSIVEDAEHAGVGATPAEKRIGAMYGACMDEAAIEVRGLAPLQPILARIDAAETPQAILDVVADLHAHGLAALWGIFIWPDAHEVRRMMLTIDRGALGMSARGDYTSSDARAVKLRAEYREHLIRLFRLIDPTRDAATQADRVVAFESALAPRALTPVEERDADAQYHPTTMAELQARYPALDVPGSLAKLGAPSLDRVNVAVPPWFEGLNAALASGDREGMRAYLRAFVATRFAPESPKAFEEERFAFEQRAVRGTREMRPRWKRCVDLVDATIGDDVGRVFLARHWTGEAKERMAKMIDALRTSYARKFAASDWMSPEAKRAALEKLARLLIVTGGSNRPRDLDALSLDRADLFGDVWSARAFEMARQVGLLSKPTDREMFFDALPQALDGFETHELLGVGFTAGFLQPPVFDARMDDPINYGGLGGVIGHEVSHEFDDEGRKYDVDGNLHPWWSTDDVTRYEARAQCFIDEYSRFRTEEGTPLDGKLTLGENLADNNGLRASYDALQPSESGPKVDGFTPAQRFFLAWGQIRCENVTPEAERRQALTDEHSSGRWRVDGVVSNMPEFASAFACKAGAAMAPEKKCRLW